MRSSTTEGEWVRRGIAPTLTQCFRTPLPWPRLPSRATRSESVPSPALPANTFHSETRPVYTVLYLPTAAAFWNTLKASLSPSYLGHLSAFASPAHHAIEGGVSDTERTPRDRFPPFLHASLSIELMWSVDSTTTTTGSSRKMPTPRTSGSGWRMITAVVILLAALAECAFVAARTAAASTATTNRNNTTLNSPRALAQARALQDRIDDQTRQHHDAKHREWANSLEMTARAVSIRNVRLRQVPQFWYHVLHGHPNAASYLSPASLSRRKAPMAEGGSPTAATDVDSPYSHVDDHYLLQSFLTSARCLTVRGTTGSLRAVASHLQQEVESRPAAGLDEVAGEPRTGELPHDATLAARFDGSRDSLRRLHEGGTDRDVDDPADAMQEDGWRVELDFAPNAYLLDKVLFRQVPSSLVHHITALAALSQHDQSTDEQQSSTLLRGLERDGDDGGSSPSLSASPLAIGNGRLRWIGNRSALPASRGPWSLLSLFDDAAYLESTAVARRVMEQRLSTLVHTLCTAVDMDPFPYYEEGRARDELDRTRLDSFRVHPQEFMDFETCQRRMSEEGAEEETNAKAKAATTSTANGASPSAPPSDGGAVVSDQPPHNMSFGSGNASSVEDLDPSFDSSVNETNYVWEEDTTRPDVLLRDDAAPEDDADAAPAVENHVSVETSGLAPETSSRASEAAAATNPSDAAASTLPGTAEEHHGGVSGQHGAPPNDAAEPPDVVPSDEPTTTAAPTVAAIVDAPFPTVAAHTADADVASLGAATPLVTRSSDTGDHEHPPQHPHRQPPEGFESAAAKGNASPHHLAGGDATISPREGTNAAAHPSNIAAVVPSPDPVLG